MFVTVTSDLIDSGRCAAGGWNKHQLAILGVKWPPPTGWKARAVGRNITTAESIRFAALRGDPSMRKAAGETPKKLSSSRAQKKKNRRQRRRQTEALRRQNVPYAEYLKTSWWANIRRKKFAATRGRCELCPSRASQVHHRHYRTLWAENLTDLIAVCRRCHEKFHECLVTADNHLRSIANSD